MSHFARRTLARLAAPEPAPVPTPQRTITIPRLWVWVPPRTVEDIKAGRAGWLPAAVAGTAWDAQNARLQYRAQRICTLWIKAGLENCAA